MKDYLTAEEARKLNRTSDKEINRYLTEILNLVYEGAKDGKLACIYEKRGNKLPQEVRNRYKMIFRMKDPKENIENWKDLSFSDLVKLCEMREEFFESVKYNGTIVKGYDLPRHNFRIRL